MSKLNDFDCELDVRTSLEFYEAYKDLRSHLFNTRQIPKDELQLLVVSAYNNEVITIGKACELLNCTNLEFREIW
jgi:predicted HTH domain antitoxin